MMAPKSNLIDERSTAEICFLTHDQILGKDETFALYIVAAAAITRRVRDQGLSRKRSYRRVLIFCREIFM
jgi:hypothetical protein